MSERSVVDLADAVRAAGWSTLLPLHRVDGGDQPVGAPTCLDVQPLGHGLVLAIVADARRRVYPAPLVVTRDGVRRARPGDGASEALLRLLADPCDAIDSVDVMAWHHERAAGERGITVDQTNESVIVGDRAVVKWAVVADEGPHPAPSILDELEHNGFTGTPRPWGAVQWLPADSSAPRLLALAVDFVPGAVDGWTWVVDDIRDAASSGDEYLARAGAAALGRLVAEFHGALARTARPATDEEAASWREGAFADLDRALEVTRGGTQMLLARHVEQVRAVFEAMPVEATSVMRVHGDLHVGQVLRSMSEQPHPSYLLTDFDGNPVVPAGERLTEQPAALDVAGMAQSFLHAGLVVHKHTPTLDGEAVTRMAKLAREAFLDAYRDGLGARATLLDSRLLRPFALRQVCREFTYAATHLPRWSYVPEAALLMLLEEEGEWSRTCS